MYHISDCKKYNRCQRLFLLSRQEESRPIYQNYVRLDEAVTDLAVKKLGIKDYYLGERGDDSSRALQAMNDYNWLVKARFEYGGLRIKVAFMHKNRTGWDIYFLFAGLYPKANDMQFYCDTVWVLQGLGIQVKRVRMIHLNADYVRGDKLDVQQLFTISDHFYNDHNHPTYPIKKRIEQYHTDLRECLKNMQNCEERGVLPAAVRSSRCTGRQKCPFYTNCFPQESSEPNNSIVTLIGAQHRFEMKEEGRLYLKDADPERIEGSRQQYAQIKADENGGLYFDRAALKTWLSHVQYPVTFLDFEWECYAIPPYKGMKPYDVLPFEYSVHVLQEDGTMTHQVFLSIHDDRRELAEGLIRDIPQNGSIIAYNAFGAETIRIAELAEHYPDLSERLLNMNARMIDLQIPFVVGLVYDTRMNGSWTLKQIMSMMDDPGYHALDIRQGMDAVFQWRYLDREAEIDEASKNTIIEDLKAYCGMDTYAMTVVYAWLKQLVKD